jgi:DNA-binding CsgD family transcriptional regulator
MSDADRARTAFHESGHALVGMLTPGADPVRKISIIPRGQALGVTLATPESDRYSYGRSQLIGRIKVALGGRAAEKVVYDEITTGAESDIQNLTQIARGMVGRWGMSDVIGPVAVTEGRQDGFLLPGAGAASPATQEAVDEETRRIVENAEREVIDLLERERPRLDALAHALLEHETLDQADAYRIAGVDQPPVSDPRRQSARAARRRRRRSSKRRSRPHAVHVQLYAAFAMSTAIIEQWYAAYDARDIDALCELAHPEVEIVPVGPVLTKLPGATFHGHTGLRTITTWSWENFPRLRLDSKSVRVVPGGILAAATFIQDDRLPQPVGPTNYTLYVLVGELVRRALTFVSEREALAVGVGTRLTPREREVLQLLARGLNAPQIGAKLFVSPATVRTHVQNAMARLGASTRIQAVSIALERGEIDP